MFLCDKIIVVYVQPVFGNINVACSNDQTKWEFKLLRNFVIDS